MQFKVLVHSPPPSNVLNDFMPSPHFTLLLFFKLSYSNKYYKKLNYWIMQFAGLSLRAGGRGFSPATKRVAPCYFYWKIEEK